jgi:hypothetical protein
MQILPVISCIFKNSRLYLYLNSEHLLTLMLEVYFEQGVWDGLSSIYSDMVPTPCQELGFTDREG